MSRRQFTGRERTCINRRELCAFKSQRLARTYNRYNANAAECTGFTQTRSIRVGNGILAELRLHFTQQQRKDAIPHFGQRCTQEGRHRRLNLPRKIEEARFYFVMLSRDAAASRVEGRALNYKSQAQCLAFASHGGEGEIRTLETLITSARFRGGCLQPLDHLSVAVPLDDRSRYGAP